MNGMNGMNTMALTKGRRRVRTRGLQRSASAPSLLTYRPRFNFAQNNFGGQHRNVFRNNKTAASTSIVQWKLREQSRHARTMGSTGYSRRNTGTKKFAFRQVPSELLYPNTKGFGYIGPPAQMEHHSKLPNPFKNWKPVVTAAADIIWPIEFTPLFAISIRPERLADFRNRMGPWASLIHHWPGTDGRRIDRGLAVAKNLVSPNARLNRGQMGCYHSHVRLWKFIVQQNISSAFICEDDADIFYSETIRSQLAVGMQQLQTQLPDWGFVYVGHNTTNRGANEEDRITENISVPKTCAGLFAYVIKKEVCEKLLQYCAPYTNAVDLFVADMINSGRLAPFRAYSFRPALCYVVPVRSDTEHIY
jgi:hypothetical protein